MKKTVLGIVILIVASAVSVWLAARPLCPEPPNRSTPQDWKRANTCQEAQALLAASTQSTANGICAQTGDRVASFRLVLDAQHIDPDGTCVADGRGIFLCRDDISPCFFGPLDQLP